MEFLEIKLETVHDRLKSLRSLSGLQQHKVGPLIGVSPKTYSNYELGVNAIPHDKLIKICEVFKISSDFLLLGKDMKESKEEAMISIRQNTQFDTKIESGYLVTTSRVPLYEFVG